MITNKRTNSLLEAKVCLLLVQLVPRGHSASSGLRLMQHAYLVACLPARKLANAQAQESVAGIARVPAQRVKSVPLLMGRRRLEQETQKFREVFDE